MDTFIKKYMFEHHIKESPDGKICDFWEFFVCLIFVKHKSNNSESRRQKEKRESN